jgi:hypothetical protein
MYPARVPAPMSCLAAYRLRTSPNLAAAPALGSVNSAPCVTFFALRSSCQTSASVIVFRPTFQPAAEHHPDEQYLGELCGLILACRLEMEAASAEDK